MRARTAVLAGLAGLGATGVGSARAALRRWETNPDPLGGPPLHLPAGDHSLVETTDGAKLEITVAGSGGCTFAMAHCWTGDRRVWGHVAERLVERGHTVVLYDHRGHGGSTTGTDPITLSVLARDLREVLDHVDARDVTLAGHSMGGMTAQAYAIEHAEHRRERISALVLVATACAGLSRGSRDPMVVRAVADDRRRGLVGTRVGALGTRHVFGRRPVLAHVLAARDTLAATPGPVRAECMAAMLAMDLRPGLRTVDVPTTVIGGERDRFVPIKHSHQIATHLPDARVEVLAGAGHMLPFERPDELADLLEGAVA